MSETASTGVEANGTASVEGAPEAPATAPAVEVTTVEQLPKFAQDLITQLRQENASTRVKGRDAVEKTKLQTTQEFEAALAESNTNHKVTQTQLDNANLTLAKLDAAIEAGIPSNKLEAVVRRLNGTTPEELKADVVEVMGLFNITPPVRPQAVDPSQGKGSAPESRVTEDEGTNYFLDLLNGNN